MPTALDHILNSPSLPSLPAVAVELLNLSRDPASRQQDFVRVTQSDPAIAAKILKLSNSSFFGIRTGVTTIQKAISMLGTRAVTSLALSFSIARQSVGDSEATAQFQNYWQKSVLQAIACETMVDFQEEHSTSELFLSGLMLDIGRLAMLKVLSGKYVDFLQRAKACDVDVCELERQEFGFDHAEAGAALLRHWDFPPTLVAAASRHHQEDPIAESDRELSEVLRLTRVAACAADYFYGYATGPAFDKFANAAEAQLGLDRTGALDLIDSISLRFRESADLFDADAYDLPDPSDLMASANQQLAELAFAAEKSQADLATEMEALRRQAIHDPLTNVYNRVYFDDVFGQEADLCRRNARSIGIVFLDIDNFKVLNDTYGHQFGDAVLIELAQALGRQLRESDVLARFGGEEFVVLARQTSFDGLGILCERLRAAAERAHFVHDGKRVPVTVSVGAAFLQPASNEAEMTDRLIKEADEAMYDVKRNGRNGVLVRSLSPEEEVAFAREVLHRQFSSALVSDDHLSTDDLKKCIDDLRPSTARIGSLCVRYGMLESWQVESVLEQQRNEQGQRRFGEIAIEKTWLSSGQLAGVLAVQAEDPDLTARIVSERGFVAPDDAAHLVESYWASVFSTYTATPVE